MVEESEIGRREFGKLLGGLLGSSLAKPGEISTTSERDLTEVLENSEYRTTEINGGYRDMAFPYDIEVKVEYGEPGEEVEYNRFLFEENDLEESSLEISSDLLKYVRSKDARTKERNIELGRRIFQEHFDGDTGSYHFARKIGETLEIEKYLEIESIESFDKAISKLNNATGIEYKNGEFQKNHYSQSIEDWMQTGW